MAPPLVLLSHGGGGAASPALSSYHRRHHRTPPAPAPNREPNPYLDIPPPRFKPPLALHLSHHHHPLPVVALQQRLIVSPRHIPFAHPKREGGSGADLAAEGEAGEADGGVDNSSSSSNNNNNNNNNNGGNGWFSHFDHGEGGWGWWPRNPPPFSLLSFLGDGGDGHEAGNVHASFLSLLLLLSFGLWLPHMSSPALARIVTGSEEGGGTSAWEVRGGKWTKLVPSPSGDAFIVGGGKEGNGVDGGKEGRQHPIIVSSAYDVLGACWRQCRDVFMRQMLPEGYPDSVTSDYLEYSLWRGVQGIASQVSGVLSTQALLYAVGLGKGAIPTAAAINWVLKDGIGYLSKIMLSKYGRHFDVNPKGWRLFADLLENAAYGMEILTPAFPHYFVLIGAAAGAGRSAAALIQAATRSCFYAGFAAQRNFAEVIAKGEAQGMVSKFLGITLGIALANFIGSSTPLALVTFSAVTGVHMYCNLKSYQSIQLRTLNPYRASLFFSEYLLSGQVPTIKEVNDEEPLFPGLPLINIKPLQKGEPHILSVEAKDAAAQIVCRLQLGSRLSELVSNKEDASALFDLFQDEGYMLVEDKGRFCVILKEGSSPEDMLKSLFHVNYLYWLETNVQFKLRSIAGECGHGGRLQISLDYVQREFGHARHDGQLHGWATDGLIARPSPNRIRLGCVALPSSPPPHPLSDKAV